VLLGIAAVWLIWTTAEIFLTAPRWAWYLSAVVLGIGWELLEEPSSWWYGVGLGAGAALLMLLTDLVLVLTDWAKLNALRNRR
jgi:hypothetical protein